MTEAQPADLNAIQRFLKSFGRSQPTIAFLDHETGGFHCRRYESPSKAAYGARYWNTEMGRSVYFVGNGHRLPFKVDGKNMVQKPSKTDIEQCVGVWIDIDHPDPDIERELIDRLDHPPAYVAFTGGGWQAHWRFDRFIADRDEAEAIGLWLIDQFRDLDPDDCWTCEHIWRLPGTINRKPGRGQLVRITHTDWASRLPIEDVGRMKPPDRAQTVPVSFSTDGWSWDRIKEFLPHNAWAMLFDRPSHCPSRSEHEFAFIGSVLSDRDPVDQSDLDLVAACLLARPTDEFCVSHRIYYVRTPKGFVERKDPQGRAAKQIGDWLAKNGRLQPETAPEEQATPDWAAYLGKDSAQ